MKCAFVVIPDSQRGRTDGCAPMRILWTQVLYQLGRLSDALVTVREALQCAPDNPDAQLIEQQLLGFIAENEAAAAEAAPTEAAPATEAVPAEESDAKPAQRGRKNRGRRR